jgi:hypothetical protein
MIAAAPNTPEGSSAPAPGSQAPSWPPPSRDRLGTLLFRTAAGRITTLARPLRLARLCREHESVCVVCPPVLRTSESKRGSSERHRHGHPPRLLRGRDLRSGRDSLGPSNRNHAGGARALRAVDGVSSDRVRQCASSPIGCGRCVGWAPPAELTRSRSQVVWTATEARQPATRGSADASSSREGAVPATEQLRCLWSS